MVPFRKPGADFKRGFDFDMQTIRWADEYGLSEVWVAEHATLGWEPVCSPELYMAAAIPQTERIKFGTGANVIPNHNPIALAHRLMQFDHMSEGRLMVGVGAGAYPSDSQIHGSTEPHEMMLEGLEIMEKIWTADGPFTFEGKFWSFEYPAFDDMLQGPFWKPYQQPHMPIAMAGLSPASGTLKQAGARGCLPMSFNVGRDYLAGHWYRYVEGAESAGLQADRNQWRIAHNVLVADTDEEAMELCLGGAMAAAYDEWMLPAYGSANMLRIMAPELEDPDNVSPQWLAENKWLVGSPDTVIEKMQADLEVSGGFGSIISFTFDYQDNVEGWRRHLELMGTEVVPKIKDIVHANQTLDELTPPDELAAAPVQPGTRK
ncbi:MAG: LLM class flavin-dependent oxidoreductase [Actinobacteria bacterium]|nr:LLM class flavin-dependent oxidoreductase [Actinomycetota bacterium]